MLSIELNARYPFTLNGLLTHITGDVSGLHDFRQRYAPYEAHTGTTVYQVQAIWSKPQWSKAWVILVNLEHYDDVIMTTIASQITSLTVVYSTVYSDADQSKHQSSASLAFVWGIHRDRWIPRTKGQLRGKCFHLMTSSWQVHPDADVIWIRSFFLHIGAINFFVIIVIYRTHGNDIKSSHPAEKRAYN